MIIIIIIMHAKRKESTSQRRQLARTYVHPIYIIIDLYPSIYDLHYIIITS